MRLIGNEGGLIRRGVVLGALGAIAVIALPILLGVLSVATVVRHCPPSRTMRRLDRRNVLDDLDDTVNGGAAGNRVGGGVNRRGAPPRTVRRRWSARG